MEKGYHGTQLHQFNLIFEIYLRLHKYFLDLELNSNSNEFTLQY